MASAVAPHARWYVPEAYKPKCPHCLGTLRDRRHPRLPGPLLAVLITGAVLASWWLTGPLAKAALTALLALFVGAHVLLRERGVPPQDRYGRDGG